MYSRKVHLTKQIAYQNLAYFKKKQYICSRKLLVDWDGIVLQTDEVNNNTLPTAPKNPNRPATAQYTYFFHAWQPDIAPALEDADYALNIYTYLPGLEWR